LALPATPPPSGDPGKRRPVPQESKHGPMDPRAEVGGGGSARWAGGLRVVAHACSPFAGIADELVGSGARRASGQKKAPGQGVTDHRGQMDPRASGWGAMNERVGAGG
jgi:hypothetical protein